MIVQLQILNYILSSKDFSFIIQNNIDAYYFPNFKSEFTFILNHYKKYNQTPDLTSFLNVFPDFEVIEVTENLNYLLSELFKEKSEGFIISTFNKVSDLLSKGKSEEAFNVFSEASQNINTNKRLEAVDILNDTTRYDSYIDKCNNFNQYYLSTGFKELDDSLGGGIDRLNSYFVVSARPGIGKTLVLIKFASAAVASGLRVGFYEGEMTVDKVAGRYDTLRSHISNGAITHGNVGVANQYKTYLDSLKDSEGKFYILTRDMVNDNKVTVDVLESFVDKYNLDILFIDQLSLLDTYGKFSRSFEQAADISKQLKNLQVRRHIPLVVASQQNRNAAEDGKIAGTENLSLSDRIGQDASEVISLTKKENILQIDIAKARDGAKKYQLKYEVDFDKGRFTYIQDGDIDEAPAPEYTPTPEGDEVF